MQKSGKKKKYCFLQAIIMGSQLRETKSLERLVFVLEVYAPGFSFYQEIIKLYRYLHVNTSLHTYKYIRQYL